MKIEYDISMFRVFNRIREKKNNKKIGYYLLLLFVFNIL